jgi:hypothetical protein
MAEQDELERYENTEAQEILRLFAAARPQQESQVPAHFRARVWSKVEQRRARHGWRAWVPGRLTLAWGLVAVLLLSLGFNAWLGLQLWAPGASDRNQAAQPHSDVPFNAYAFQAGIQSQTALGTLVAEHSTLGEQAVTLGFARQPGLRPYRVGLLYVEALVALHSSHFELAAQRLTALEQALLEEQAPAFLSAYINALRSLVEPHRAVHPAPVALLAPFEAAYAEYARGQEGERLILFRFGAWLGNMSLAAAAGDSAALRQGNLTPDFSRAMRRLSVPQGVRDALDRLDQLLTQPALTERDIAEVLKLVKKSQRLLG